MHPTRIFKSPEELEKAWSEFKEDRKEEAKQWPMVQYVGKDGAKKTDYPVLPLAVDVFVVWYYNTYGKHIMQYFKNTENLYDDFVPICTHVRLECRAHQITGGLVNQFNSSITARLNGLTEKTENTQNVNLRQITGMEVK